MQTSQGESSQSYQQVPPSYQNSQTVPGNGQQYLEKGKTISKLYFSYFLSVLKSPVPTAERIGKKELTNGIITIVLFALMIPLMTFFGLKGLLEDSFYSPDVSFSAVVLKPFFTLVVILALIAVIIFGVIKLGKSPASLLDVISRLGAFLVVPTALLFIALIISLIGSVFFAVFLILGLVGASLIIPLIVYSFKREINKGLDTFYCTFLVYIGIAILFVVLGEQAFYEIENMINNFDPFGF
ncbi:hypothetical protein [Robertmurraya kyonggiensis]|uniref:hypothetical protein n=1 Tax=Robertmurraya kyonggiensis TaxID=1037680 RepID=UPI001FECBE9F|nr:hypothetical protein [Robertmurraya kyonggiensis]